MGTRQGGRRPFLGIGRLLAVITLGLLPKGPALAQSTASPAPAQRPFDPVRGEIETNRAILDFQSGRHEDVLRRLGSFGSAPSPRASYYRGLSFLSLERAREALGQFEAVRKGPGAPAEVEIDSALAYLALGEPAKAQETLRGYLGKHPDDPYGHYFLGVALFRQEKFTEASAELDKAAADASLAPYLDFYKGLSSYSQGQSDYGGFLERFRSGGPGGGSKGATGELTRSLLDLGAGSNFRPGQAPGRPGAASASERGADSDRRWNFSVLSGYDYDSNVALVPSLAFTPIGLGGKNGPADSRWSLATFADYRLVQSDDWVLGLIGSTYNTWQFRLSDYDFQDYMGGIYSNVALGKNWILGARYEFHENLLGGAQFATDHRLTPNITFREGAVGHTTAYYEFESLDITGVPVLVPAQVRSGNINSVGVTQAFYLMEGAGRLFLGYRYDRANTKGLDFDRTTNQLDARLELPLPWKIVGNIEARYFFNDYTNPNSLDFFGNARRDRTIEARVGAQKFINSHLSLRADYIYTNNDSNVQSLFGASPFTYQRNVLNTMLIYDF